MQTHTPGDDSSLLISDNLLTPIFMKYLPNFLDDENSNDCILAVFAQSNFIRLYIFPLAKNNMDLIIPPQEDNTFLKRQIDHDEKLQKLVQSFLSLTSVCTTVQRPAVVGQLIRSSNRIIPKCELSSSFQYILISDILIDSTPSTAIFQLSLPSIKLVFKEASLGIIDATFSHDEYIYILPRCYSGHIIEIPFLENSDSRFIQNLSVISTHLKNRFSHISISGGHVIGWTDDDLPTIEIFKFDDDKYNGEMFTFKNTSRILYPVLNPEGKQLGFIMQTADSTTMICVWELGKRLIQHNYIFHEIIEPTEAKWVNTLVSGSSEIVYSVSLSFSVIEANKQKTTRITFKDPYTGIQRNVSTPDRKNFYFYGGNSSSGMMCATRDQLMKMIQITNSPGSPCQSIDISNITESGEIDSYSGIHLWRCENCHRPLLTPLISRHEGEALECRYCSQKCQKKHWPAHFKLAGKLNEQKIK